MNKNQMFHGMDGHHPVPLWLLLKKRKLKDNKLDTNFCQDIKS